MDQHVLIIGNGFDLAHGMKTSYKDFFNWYIDKIATAIHENSAFSDKIVQIFLNKNYTTSYQSHNIPKEILLKNNRLFYNIESLDNIKFSINYQSKFTRELFENFENTRWVDVESFYYSILRRIYKYSQDNIRNNIAEANKMLIDWNNTFAELIKYFEEYLITKVASEEINLIHEIQTKIDTLVYEQRVKFITIINFNYTQTIKKYINPEHNGEKVKIINIHGELKNDKNSIIFGYGDETDKHYLEMENLNNNDYLRHMKSFGYALNSNYQMLINLVSSHRYIAHILGHSCGISDRILLNTIFEHPNCISINIFYYQKNEKDDDFQEKVMEISRHFSHERKKVMRNRITPKPGCKPLVEHKSKN